MKIKIIISFVLAFNVFASSAYAATSVYDLNSSGATAWDNANVDETADPHTTVPYDQGPPEGSWTQVTGSNLTAIQSDDGSCFSNAGSTGDYTPLQVHLTNVGENPSNITQMDFFFDGGRETSGTILQVWVWDFTNTQWDKVGTDMSVTSANCGNQSFTRTLNSGFTDYIDGSDNMYILWVHDTANQDLYIDYASLTVTYTLSAPTVTTNAATAGTVSSGQLNGTIDGTGGSNATSRGFAWGTSSTLSNGDTSTTTESGSFSAGAFSHTISTLLANKTYYFRAYATNPSGTGIATQILNFTTSADSGTVSRKMYLFDGAVIKHYEGKVVIYEQ